MGFVGGSLITYNRLFYRVGCCKRESLSMAVVNLAHLGWVGLTQMQKAIVTEQSKRGSLTNTWAQGLEFADSQYLELDLVFLRKGTELHESLVEAVAKT